MKILYVTSNIYSISSKSASIRNSTIIKGLTELGNKVDVLTLDLNENLIDKFLEKKVKCKNIYKDKSTKISFINKFFLKIAVNCEKKSNGILLQIKKIIKHLIISFIFFPDLEKGWIKNYNKNLDYEKYDLIISSTGTITSHYVGLEIKKAYPNIKWIQIWGDPWFGATVIKWIVKIRAFFSEKKLLKKADKVFYVSKPTLKDMKESIPELASKFEYIPRAYFKKVVSECDFNKTKEYILTYTGIISSVYGRNIDTLLNAIKKFNDISEVKIRLNIYGECDKVSEDQIKKLNFAEFFGNVEYNEILDIYINSNGLLFLSNKKGSNQIPGKLFDYFGTNKSILAVMEDVNDEVAKFIKSTNRALISNNDENKLKEALALLIKDEKRTPLNEYSGLEVAKQLLSKI